LEAVMDPVIRHLSNPFTKNGMDIAKRLLFHTFAQDTVSGTLRYVAFALGRRALSLGS
jgi:hypothetical protein